MYQGNGAEETPKYYSNLGHINIGQYAWSLKFVQDAHHYLWSKFHQSLRSSECTFWIRRSTCQLCAELTPHWNSINASVTDTMLVDVLPLEVYHDVCSSYLGHSVSIPLFHNRETG
ncbi:hypothetical protein C8J57DRAFT_1473052, partial [Mycena rebaudengoi]